jgi:hypothetical protein
MAKKNDHLADFATENTGGVLTGFLADEEHLDRRAMLRLGTWGAASVGAIIVALLANQSSLRLRHDELAAADLSRQAQQIQSVARESQSETRRLASAIDTLNGDRDRMYSRLSTLEQGLDSVTGAIARQSNAAPPPAPAASTASAAPTAAAPASATPSAPQPAAEAAAPAPEAAATETAPLIGPVATTTAVMTGKQTAEAKRREQANAKMAAATLTPIPAPIPAPSPAVPAPSSPPATTATMPPLVASKSMMGPPDPAAPKLIEPEPAKTAAANALPATAQAPPTPAPQPAPAIAATTPETATATRDTDKVAVDKPVTDKPVTEKSATAETPQEASPQVAVNRTEFGVDVGGANSVGGLRALWRGLLKSRSNAALAALQPIIVIKESNSGLGMQLRLVAGPLTDAAAAAKICATMVENERPCATTVYDGQHLAMKVEDAPASTGAISPKTSTERSSEPEAEKPVAEKPAAPKSGSGRQTWRRRSYQKRTAVEETPAEKPKSTTASTISSFFHRSN